MWWLWWTHICRSQLTYLISCSPLNLFFFLLYREWVVCLIETQRKEFFFTVFPFKRSLFLFRSLTNSIYGLSEISNAWETATSCFQQHLLQASLTLSFSMGLASAWAWVLCSAKQGDLSYEDRQKADLALGQCHAPRTDSTGHWAEGIRHGCFKRKITDTGRQQGWQWWMALKSSSTTTPFLTKGTLFYIQSK